VQQKIQINKSNQAAVNMHYQQLLRQVMETIIVKSCEAVTVKSSPLQLADPKLGGNHSVDFDFLKSFALDLPIKYPVLKDNLKLTGEAKELFKKHLDKKSSDVELQFDEDMIQIFINHPLFQMLISHVIHCHANAMNALLQEQKTKCDQLGQKFGVKVL
jgi:hypothetical protein